MVCRWLARRKRNLKEVAMQTLCDEELASGAVRKTLNDLVAWTAEVDKVLVF